MNLHQATLVIACGLALPSLGVEEEEIALAASCSSRLGAEIVSSTRADAAVPTRDLRFMVGAWGLHDATIFPLSPGGNRRSLKWDDEQTRALSPNASEDSGSEIISKKFLISADGGRVAGWIGNKRTEAVRPLPALAGLLLWDLEPENILYINPRLFSPTPAQMAAMGIAMMPKTYSIQWGAFVTPTRLMLLYQAVGHAFLLLYDVKGTGALISALELLDWISTPLLSPDSRTLLLVGGSLKSRSPVQRIEMATGRELSRFYTEQPVTGVFLGEGSVGLIDLHHRFCVYDSEGNLLRKYHLSGIDQGSSEELLLSSHPMVPGKILLTAGDRTTLIDLVHGREEFSVQIDDSLNLLPKSWQRLGRFSPDGKYFFTFSQSGILSLWDTGNGSLRNQIHLRGDWETSGMDVLPSWNDPHRLFIRLGHQNVVYQLRR